MDQDLQTTFTLLVSRKEEATEALQKLKKKAERNGYPDISWVFSNPRNEVREIYSRRVTRKIGVQLIDLTIIGFETAPVIQDHKFLARVEFTDAGNIIDRIPDAVIPQKYRDTTCFCEHCKISRRRKSVYILETPKGETIQVGKSCLKEYLGKETPESILYKFNMIRQFKELSDTYGKFFMDYSTAEMIAVTAAVIRLYGWVSMVQSMNSSGDITATANIMRVWYDTSSNEHVRKEQEKINAELKEEDWDLLGKIREWLTTKEQTDYIYNLGVILSGDTVDPKRISYAVSSVAAYLKDMAILETKKKEQDVVSTSAFVGVVGDKITTKVVLSNAKTIEGRFGNTILFTFEDNQGNIYKWFSTNCPKLQIGSNLSITGTVKEHSTFRDVKQTMLTRVKTILIEKDELAF